MQNTQAWEKRTGQRGPETTGSLLKSRQESRVVVTEQPGWLAGGKGLRLGSYQLPVARRKPFWEPSLCLGMYLTLKPGAEPRAAGLGSSREGRHAEAAGRSRVLLQLPVSLVFTRGLQGIQSISSCCSGSRGVSSAFKRTEPRSPK